MERRKVTREWKLEAVPLIKDQRVPYVQAAQDLGLKSFAEDPQIATAIACAPAGASPPPALQSRHSPTEQTEIRNDWPHGVHSHTTGAQESAIMSGMQQFELDRQVQHAHDGRAPTCGDTPRRIDAHRDRPNPLMSVFIMPALRRGQISEATFRLSFSLISAANTPASSSYG